MSQNVEEQVLDFVRGRFPQERFDADQDIFQLGFVNSLFALELVMFIEKTFAITIRGEELQIDNFRTATAMAALVARHQQAPAASGA
ncbi:acyl carrier protein [Labedaea rhizosphaerae]|uniref:Acyl carrier protein n=1 Tax=Labedaea rhizosphaerae TaxID=598644 RepID=A0A4R6SFP4_LABRH|nr:acyl carrier protein [Labedaea rhizosphaerae]TDQ00455.1 acyl carrier protein [Labedaea rhizosphaerae]